MTMAILAVTVVPVAMSIVSGAPAAIVFEVSMLSKTSMRVLGVVYIMVTRSVGVAVTVATVSVIWITVTVAASAWIAMTIATVIVARGLKRESLSDNKGEANQNPEHFGFAQRAPNLAFNYHLGG